MSKTKEPPRLLAIHESGDVTHYRVSSGEEGGQPATVRIGAGGVFCCMSCYVKGPKDATDCVHVRTVKQSLTVAA